MTPEEMERATEFLLDHHARFAAELEQGRADLQIITETQREFQAQLGRLGDAVIAMTGMFGRVAEAQVATDKRVAEIAEAQLATNQQVGEIALRLNDFIVVVERYISGGRTGRNP